VGAAPWELEDSVYYVSGTVQLGSQLEVGEGVALVDSTLMLSVTRLELSVTALD
jgi:hypothetical protein